MGIKNIEGELRINDSKVLARTQIDLATLQANLHHYRDNETLIQIVPIAPSGTSTILSSYVNYGGPCFFTVAGNAAIYKWISNVTLTSSELYVSVYSLQITNVSATVFCDGGNYAIGDSSAQEMSTITMELTDENCKFYIFK